MRMAGTWYYFIQCSLTLIYTIILPVNIHETVYIMGINSPNPTCIICKHHAFTI